MADEYVPTTREMESAYVCDSLGAGIDEAEARRRFSRWIAAHDRETAARAWDEGFEEPRECCGLCPLRSCPWDNGGDGPTNPYREGDPT